MGAIDATGDDHRQARSAVVLVLGGTTEAATLAARLARASAWSVRLALAGRTATPRSGGAELVIGGFGGAAGLRRHLEAEWIAALIDATHPFAVRMARNARRAALVAGVPRLKLERPPWRATAHDRWHHVLDLDQASRVAATLGRRPFVSLGAAGGVAFDARLFERVYLRTIERPVGVAPNVAVMRARGPFEAAAEQKLFLQLGVDVLVSRNAGGAATRGKLIAARTLGLPVVMVSRPAAPVGPIVTTVDDAIDWLDQLSRSRQT